MSSSDSEWLRDQCSQVDTGLVREQGIRTSNTTNHGGESDDLVIRAFVLLFLDASTDMKVSMSINEFPFIFLRHISNHTINSVARTAPAAKIFMVALFGIFVRALCSTSG
jgi:hypothetical protein